jgi:hypothetical protein
MPTDVQKICSSCGIDVSQQKRIKDEKGRYYCHPCWTERGHSVQLPQPSAPPISSPAARTSAPTQSTTTYSKMILATAGVAALCLIAGLSIHVLSRSGKTFQPSPSPSKISVIGSSPNATVDPVASFNAFVKDYLVAADQKAQSDKLNGFLSYTFDVHGAAIDIVKSDSLISPCVGKMKVSVWDGYDSHQVEAQFQFTGGKWVLYTVTSSTETSDLQKVGTKLVAGIPVDDTTRVSRTKDDSDDMRKVVADIIQIQTESPQQRTEREEQAKRLAEQHAQDLAADEVRKRDAEKARIESMDIYEAASSGATSRVRELLDAAPGLARQQHITDGTVNTPLHVAANGEIATLLVRAGADVNAQDNYHCTPLHDAANAGRVDVISVLIQSHANMDVVDDTIGTPLGWAAMGGKLDAVKLLVTKGCDINAKGPHGETALGEAANTGKLDVVEFLVASGADINASADEGGRTALDLAIESNKLDVATFLRSKGGKSTQ